MRISPEEIQNWRAETPGCQTHIHLNNAGAALPPAVVLQTMVDYLEAESRVGGYELAAKFREEISGFYKALGKLLHCSAQHIAYTTNATDSYSKALSSIPFANGDVILTTTDDYVSNYLAFLNLEKRSGARTIVARRQPSGDLDLDHLRELALKHQPKLLAVTHIPTSSGLVQPIIEAGSISKEVGSWYLVDACQSVGQRPLDVQKIGCDFLTATYRKYLRGPRGAGFLYVSSRALEAQLEPLFVDAAGADWQGTSYKIKQDATRFELWEKSYALVLGAKAATEYALNIGLDRIAHRVTDLANKLRKRLEKIPGVQVLDRGTDLCGIVTVSLPGQEPYTLLNRLREAGLACSISDKGSAWFDFTEKKIDWALRLSPHYYNTEDELDQAADMLKVTLR